AGRALSGYPVAGCGRARGLGLPHRVWEPAGLDGAARRVRVDADGGRTTLPPPPRHAAGRRRKPLHGLRELPRVRRRDAASAPRPGAELLGGPEDACVVPAESVLRRLVVRLEPDSVLDRVGPRADLAVSDAEIPVRDVPRARPPRLVLRDARPR